ncbi:MAG: UDP-N-acetylmuramate--L-alanine ligase [Minisyncoccia bacterium]|jgi:UDP-N-acetylmuramate--alanine ligase
MKIYFIGIGGIGMSALARLYKAKGWDVAGSDAVPSMLIATLRKEGIHVDIGHKKENIKPNVGLVVYNRAIHPDNPEIRAARKLRIETLPYAEVLGKLTKEYMSVAITGSHGKSTTTALAALTLIAGGYDPTVLIGTTLKEFGGKNVRVGRGDALVLEADDFGAAFTAYSPTVAIVTNIDREHLDFYKSFTNVKAAFIKFLSHVRPGGLMILNRDDLPLWGLRNRIREVAKKNSVTTVWYSLHGPAMKKIKKVIGIPGIHNVSNATAVSRLGAFLEIPEKKVLAAIHGYHGAWRRMELRGTFKGAPVYDDYAHHPTEIAATLQALREKFPKKKILCVFQPHQTQRTALLFKEFQTAFDMAHETLILPIYRVAGRDAVIPNRDSAALVRAIQKKQPRKPIFYLADPKKLKDAIIALDGAPLSRKVIVMMGAGDIVKLTDTLVL